MKLIILTIILSLIALFAVYGKGMKETLVRKLYLQNPNYNCNEGNVCTTCVVEGKTCKCTTSDCLCGEKVVPKSVCELVPK